MRYPSDLEAAHWEQMRHHFEPRDRRSSGRTDSAATRRASRPSTGVRSEGATGTGEVRGVDSKEARAR